MSEGRIRVLAILYLILFFFAYPMMGMAFEIIDDMQIHEVFAAISIIFVYPLMWCGIMLAFPTNDGLKEAKRRLKVALPIYLVLLLYLTYTILPPALTTGFQNPLVPIVLIGFSLAYLNPVLIGLMIYLEQELERKKKETRRRGVENIADLEEYRKLGDAEGLGRILEEHEDIHVRRAALDILFDIRNTKMLKYLSRVIEDPDQYIRLRSAVLLMLGGRKKGWPMIQEYFEELSDHDRLEVVKWIPEIEWKGSRRILEKALTDDVSEIRKLAEELIEFY